MTERELGRELKQFGLHLSVEARCKKIKELCNNEEIEKYIEEIMWLIDIHGYSDLK